MVMHRKPDFIHKDDGEPQPTTSKVQGIDRNQKIIEAMGLHSIPRIALLSLFLVLFYAWFSAPMSARHFVEIAITATGKHPSLQAKGAQVWLLSPAVTELRRRHLDVQTTQGWDRDGEIFYSVDHHPAQLIIRGYFARQDRITLLKHPWSGEAIVEINGRSTLVDLYHNGSGYHSISVHDYLPRTNAWSGGIMLEDVVRALKHFLLTFSVLMLLYPVYRGALPRSAHISRFDVTVTDFRKKSLILLLMTATILVLFASAFYPGVMTDDSYWQYEQILQYSFNDWHPPMMAAIWAVWDRFIEGPGGMLLFHLILAMTSLYLISRVALQAGKKLFFIPLGLVFLPPVGGILFVIWKDVSLALSFLFAFSLWYYFRSNGTLNRRRLAVILGFVFYGWCVRHNALTAAIPLIFLFLLELGTRRKAVLMCTLIVMLFYAGDYIITYKLLRAQKYFISQTVLSHDLMAIYAKTKRNYFPREYLTQERLDTAIEWFDELSYFPTTHQVQSYITLDPLVHEKLRANWIRATIHHPGIYLQHRWRLFQSFLLQGVWVVVPRSESLRAMPSGIVSLTQETRAGGLYTAFVRFVDQTIPFLFAPIAYLFLGVAIAAFSVRRRVIAAAGLSLSAVLYILPYFFIAPLANYRLTYWSTIATILSICVLWIETGGRGEGAADVTKIPAGNHTRFES